MILAFVMVLCLLPASVFATEGQYVYISVSYDGQYIADKNGEPIAYIPVSFEEVAAVDLNAYDLGDYLYDADGDGTYEITALQLVIYAHENLFGGSWSDVTFTGSPGSSYFEGGIFGFDENLNYYLNGEYPLASEGWGATSDQIVLHAGDYLDIGSFSSWNFYGDSNYGFHFFADSEGAFVHNYSVDAGAELPIKLVRSFSAMGSGAAVYDEPYYEVSYGTSLYDAAGTVTTDDIGCAAITFDTAGTWYLWCNGGYGCEFPDDIVSTPAYAKVTVTGEAACEHIAVIDAAVPATCTATGLTEGQHCSLCGEVLVAQEEIPVTDHTYAEWVVTQAPTFTEPGQQEKTCQQCTDTITEVIPAATGKVEQWNITLTDALNVNFYLNISQSIESTATVKITVGDAVVTHRVKELDKTEEGLYVAHIELAAAQMTDDIVVFVMNNNAVGSYVNYTIRQYADAVLADEDLSQYHTLVKEMLNYGAAAQAYFDYCADTPADEGITGTGNAQLPTDADQELTVTGSAEGVSFYGTTLSFRDRIAVRYYFRFQGDINAVSFTANGTACAPGLKNGLYYVEVPDILPQSMDQEIELVVTDASGSEITICYSPMNYIVRMGEKGSEFLQALLQALYNYHLAAKEVAAQG